MSHRILWTVGGTAAAVTLVWLTANALLTVQLPERGPAQVSLDAAASTLPLHEAYLALPVSGGGPGAVHLFDHNPTAWAARWELLSNARESLDVSYFILEQDVFGAAFLGHLIKRSQEGVRIRILLDAMGTKMARDLRGNDYLDALVNTQAIEVKMYRPLLFRYLDAFLTLNPAAIFASYHDKILLADRQLAIVGGRNIGQEYFAAMEDDPLAFHDADLSLHGESIGATLREIFESQYGSGEARPVARETLNLQKASGELLLAHAAMDAWLRDEPIDAEVERRIQAADLPWIEQLRKLPGLRGALNARVPPPVRAPVRLLDSRTRLLAPDDPITQGLALLVRSAEREIFIQNPYVVLSDQVADLLADAGRRGVRITILTNSPLSSDNALSQAFFMEQWPHLLARIPNLRIYVAGNRHNVHSKLAAIDRRLALVGTYNLDPLSMAINSELVAAIWSEEFVTRLLEKPLAMIAGSVDNVYQYQIARLPDGRPVLEDGEPVVRFGPEDHTDPSRWKTAHTYRRILRAAEYLPGVSALY